MCLIAAFTGLNMPDTFYSWFLVTELHVWMLMARLMNEGEKGRLVRNAVVEALWQDVDFRSKQLGVLRINYCYSTAFIALMMKNVL